MNGNLGELIHTNDEKDPCCSPKCDQKGVYCDECTQCCLLSVSRPVVYAVEADSRVRTYLPKPFILRLNPALLE